MNNKKKMQQLKQLLEARRIAKHPLKRILSVIQRVFRAIATKMLNITKRGN